MRSLDPIDSLMNMRRPHRAAHGMASLTAPLDRRQALGMLALLAAGCQEFDLRLQSPEERARDKARENASAALRGVEGHSPLIGNYINVRGLNTVVLEGVGLVTNLDRTGDDPPASTYRTQLLEDMRKRDIKDPNQIIADPTTTLVLVRAYLPPLIKKGERFDVEVRLPDGSEATSLKGGVLMQCELTEQAYVPGRGVLKGHRLAIAHGPVLAIGQDGQKDALRRGTIPAGAVYVGLDQNLSLQLRPDYRSVRMSQNIAHRIGQRFHDYDDSGNKRPLAEAKTDTRIELIVHRRYRDNYPRYLQCISQILLRDTPVERRLRMERLRDELLSGPTAEAAALELEAIGTEAVPVLREGLQSEVLEVRFHSAQALAYLGYSEAAGALREAADKEPAFRVFALAGLAAIGGVDAVRELRKLLSHESLETRYGAVRALSTIDEHDPAIQREEAPRGFVLRVVEGSGEPMVHVTQRQKAEIVLFGADQQFQPPMIVSAGRHFLIKADPGRPSVTISRFVEGRDVTRSTVSARVADVIRELGRMQASYPDVVQMLVEAERQRNLPGKIGIDVLPRSGRIYTRPDQPAGNGSAVGSQGLAPNLFGIELDTGALPIPVDDSPLDDPQAAAPQSESPPGSETSLNTDPLDQVGFTVR